MPECHTNSDAFHQQTFFRVHILIHCIYLMRSTTSCMYYHKCSFVFKGGSLHALIKRARQYDDVINETELMEWLVQIALALQHLHAR